MRFFFVERGGLAVFLTAVRCAHRTTFRCWRLGNLHKCSPALLNESTHHENPCYLHGFSFFEKPLPFSWIFVVLPRNRYSLSKQVRIKHKATISLYRLLGVDFFVRFFFVERGGLAVCQTAVRYAHRTTFSVLTLGQFAQVQPCAIKRIHQPAMQSISHNLLNLPC